MSIQELRQRFPWPTTEPDVPSNADGWFSGENQKALSKIVGAASVVVELGAWMGLSTRYLAEQCPGTVISIDHWMGSEEHAGWECLSTLYETFIKNCWQYRHKLIPVRMDTIGGMELVASLGIQPQVVYIDASHDRKSVANDIVTAIKLFPEAHLIGDDWTWNSVRDGVFDAMTTFTGPARGRPFAGHLTCWELLPPGKSLL